MAEVFRAKGYAGSGASAPAHGHDHDHAHRHDHDHTHDHAHLPPLPPLRSTPSQPLTAARPVSVNGITIDPAVIAQEMQHHPADKPDGAWTAAASALVVRELLLQEARRLELKAVPTSDAEGRRETDDEALVRALVEREVATPEADEAVCRRYYDQNRNKFRSSDLYEVRHILFAAAPADGAARSQARAEADAAIATLRAKSATFAELAAAHSACPSGRNGGSLSQISRGQTVPEFESALAAAAVGEVGQSPIETRYGFHVTLVDRKIPGEALPFEMVKPKIAGWLTEQVRRVAIRQYITLLASRAQISGITLGLDETVMR